jgi:hypothetical protein
MVATRSVSFASLCLLIGLTADARAHDSSVTDSVRAETRTEASVNPQPTMQIYGFVEADAIVDLEQNNGDWYDTNRPSKLPAFAHEFGQDGHFYLSPRQSRFGLVGTLPTSAGDVQATFEFDMIGTGANAGLTTIRLRHAWGQWKQIGAGQTYSQFMDADVYPARPEPWGPNGMLTSRNPQVFWEPYRDGGSNARIAIENPGVSADGGLFADRIDVPHVTPRFPMPDITAHYRHAESWGYVQAGGAILYIAYDDRVAHDPFNSSGHVWGWGASLSSNVHAGPDDLLRLQVVYGHGIENYFNDAPVDVGVKLNPGNAATPIVGEALPVVGVVAYLEHNWADAWSTSAGYSRVDVKNSDGELPSAFRTGEYATANLMWKPEPTRNLVIGEEVQWAHRRNFSDGWTANDYRLVFFLKCNFSHKLGG